MPHRSSTPKVEFPETVSYLSVRDAYPGSSRVGIIFLLVILVSVEKGKQRYNKTTEDNQKPDYPNKYQNDICSCLWRRLPSYVFRQASH